MQRGPSDYNKIENEVCVRINAKEKKKKQLLSQLLLFFFLRIFSRSHNCN